MNDFTNKLIELEKAITICQMFIRENKKKSELEKMVIVFKDILKYLSDDYNKLLGEYEIDQIDKIRTINQQTFF